MIIGREKEQRELLSLLEKEKSQFCAVYGRRRVGKTREEILAASKLSDGGTFSTILEELEESGFVRRFASADTAETNAPFILSW